MLKLLVLSTLFAASIALGDRTIPNSPDELKERVETAFEAADAEIAQIIAIDAQQRTYENTIGAIDDLIARLDSASNLA
ncbi:MAG TPA: hypothetical protein EYM64_00275, partial [Phycisphaerales bacterium]|nr:hypothetical protein [Phycisphaerales bacterium]